MARIIDYTALTTPADTDVLVIEDLAAGSTKKITRGDLLTYGTRYTEQQGGWFSGSGTWTYATASTFTVPAADAALLSPGSKVRLVQTTTKYFNVASKSGTTITIVVNSDYTLANAAITSPYLSNVATPVGFPQWFNYAPTENGFTTPPTRVTRFQILGRTCIVSTARSNNTTSNATTYTFSLPVVAATVSGMAWKGVLSSAQNNSSALSSATSYLVSSAATVANLFTDMNGGAWTASGTKGADFTLMYEI